MSDKTAVSLVARYNTLFTEQTQWRAYWQELADYYLPRKANIIRMRPTGSQQTEFIFNNSGGRAITRLASNINGALTSQAYPWFSWVAEQDQLNDDKEAAEWFEGATKRGYKAFAADDSNFYPQAHEFYIDLVTFHTAALLFEAILEDGGAFKHFAFKTLQIGTYVIDENHYGKVDTLCRRFEMSARNAVQRLGWKNLSEDIHKAAKDKPDTKFGFLHCVMPTEDYERSVPEYKNFGGKVDKPFASIWVELKGETIIGDVQGYDTFPFIVARWNKTSGELYGRGPAMEALPDVKTLNKAAEFKLEAWALALRPPLFMEDDGVIGDVDWVPGGITVKRKGSEFGPVVQGSDFRVAEIEEEKIVNAISQSFFNLDFNLPENKDMTIPELDERVNERNQLVSPAYARLKQEWLGPLTTRAFNILLEAKEFAELPDSLQGQDFTVKFEGPLDRAQRSTIVQNIVRTRQAVMSAAGQLNPAAFDNFDDDQETRIIADALGYPKKAMRDDKAVQEKRDQRQQQEMATKLAGAAEPVTGAVKNLADAGKSMALAKQAGQQAQQQPQSEAA